VPVTDIIIGARHGRPRPRRLRLLGSALALLAIYLGARWLFASLVGYPTPDVEVPRGAATLADEDGDYGVRIGDDTLSRRGGLWVIRAAGEPGAMGAAVGRLLATEVAEAAAPRQLAAVAGSEVGLVARALGGEDGDWRLRDVDDGIPGHQLIEIAGIAAGARRAGAGVDYTHLVRAQASPDLGGASADSSGGELRAVARALTVVAPVSAGGSERLVMARSFALPGLADGGEASARARLVRFLHPDGVIAFAAVGDPAIAGAITGINAEGLIVAVHPIRSAEAATSPSAQPVALLARDILENARSIEQAIAVLEAATPLGSALFVIVDGNGREAAVIERTPQRFAVRRDEPPLVVVDLLESEELRDDPESERNRRRRPDRERAARAAKLVADPLRAPADLAALLRDRGPAGKERVVGHRGTLNDAAATHAAIVDPAAMVLWAGEGPGTSGAFRAFDLRHELRAEGKRAAPPPDIPADADDLAAAARVIEARALLRAARKSEREGARPRARELADRALLVTPELPEALLLAGDLASRAGDQEAATRHHRALRRVGIDLPGERSRIEGAGEENAGR
jgi:hypothetical protein